nr:uncharacterized protein LOC128699790 [Cherax quadricarinatus]
MGESVARKRMIITVEMIHDSAIAIIHGVPVSIHNCSEMVSNIGVVTLMVIHPATAHILRTYHHPSHAHAGPLQRFLTTLQYGRLLLVTASVLWMEDSVKEILTQLGATIPHVPRWERAVWAWMGVVGGGTLAQMAASSHFLVHQRAFLEVLLPRTPDEPWCPGVRPPSEDGRRWAARVALCTAYDGYGDWCSCPPPSLQTAVAPEVAPPRRTYSHISQEGDLDDAVTVILASRPESLHRLLMQVWEAGVHPTHVIVFTSDATQEMRQVCESHGVYLEETQRSSDCAALHITLLYESALTAALVLRPRAEYFITLEDDMVLKPTFYRWMSEGRRAVAEGSSSIKQHHLLCVNSMRPDTTYTLYTYHHPPRPPPPTTPHTHVHATHHATHSLTTGTHHYQTSITKLSHYINSSGADPSHFNSSSSSNSSSSNSSSSTHYFEIDKVTSSVNKAADSLLQSVTLRENSVINTRHPQHWKEEKSIEKNEQEEEEEEEETVNEVAAESISSFLAGWGAERPVVEAMIRLWPLAAQGVTRHPLKENIKN